jgi:hypothetical protein
MWLLKYSRVVKRIKEFILCGLDKLQKFQNRATESAVVLKTLGWETLKSSSFHIVYCCRRQHTILDDLFFSHQSVSGRVMYS